jgi:lysophospholipase L1-like esterase
MGRWGSRARQSAPLAVWSLAVAIAALAGAEFVLRAAGSGNTAPDARHQPPWMDDDTYALWRDWAEDLDVPLEDVAGIGWQHDPELRMSLKPNLSFAARNIFLDSALGDEAMWRLETNRFGYRSHDYDPARPPGALRVVTLGDSNTMGWMLDEEDCYPRRLEQHLAERLARPIELVNLGVAGFTSFGVRRVFEREVPALDPDAIVVSVGANDPQSVAWTDAEFAAGAPAGRVNAFRQWLGSLRLTRLLHDVAGPSAQMTRVRVGPADYAANLRAVLDAAKELGVPVVFARVCCCPNPYQRVLETTLARYRVPLVDTDRELRRAYGNGSGLPPEFAERANRVAGWYAPDALRSDPALHFYFLDKCHLNPLGADIVGKALAERLAVPLERAGN